MVGALSMESEIDETPLVRTIPWPALQACRQRLEILSHWRMPEMRNLVGRTKTWLIQNRPASISKTYGEQTPLSGVSRPAGWPSLNAACWGTQKAETALLDSRWGAGFVLTRMEHPLGCPPSSLRYFRELGCHLGNVRLAPAWLRIVTAG